MEGISWEQRAWLFSKGGRTLQDLFTRKGKHYITMRTNDGEEFYGLPTTEAVKNNLDFSKSYLKEYYKNYVKQKV